MSTIFDILGIALDIASKLEEETSPKIRGILEDLGFSDGAINALSDDDKVEAATAFIIGTVAVIADGPEIAAASAAIVGAEAIEVHGFS